VTSPSGDTAQRLESSGGTAQADKKESIAMVRAIRRSVRAAPGLERVEGVLEMGNDRVTACRS